MAPALADTTSGWYYRGSTGPFWPGFYIDNCVEANTYVYPPVTHEGLIRASVSPNGCSGALANPGSGWLGIAAEGFSNGNFCGWTHYQYNTTSGFKGTSGNFCNNPDGLQEFHTVAFGRVWIYQNNNYYDVNYVTSPSLNN